MYSVAIVRAISAAHRHFALVSQQLVVLTGRNQGLCASRDTVHASTERYLFTNRRNAPDGVKVTVRSAPPQNPVKRTVHSERP